MTQVPPGGVYIRRYLAPLAAMLERADVTDIYINRPGELWIETLGGGIERHEAPDLGAASLMQLARQVAAFAHQAISREHPLLSASLPDGSRIQIVAPPATRGDIAIAVRKHVSSDLSLGDYDVSGAFDGFRERLAQSSATIDDDLERRLASGDVSGMLAAAVRARRNILVSGGTSTGKTTFLNALIKEIPSEERLILIEDTPELQAGHTNLVGLVAARSALGETRVTADDLVSASLRMRPDRIILGELRGTEAFAFLRAINTGHPGSMTTVHADSTEGAIEQIALLVLQGGTQLNRSDVLHYVRQSIGVFVQLSRVAGRRIIDQVTLQGRSPAS